MPLNIEPMNVDPVQEATPANVDNMSVMIRPFSAVEEPTIFMIRFHGEAILKRSRKNLLPRLSLSI